MAEITFHGQRFLEIEHGAAKLLLDPSFGETRRGRRSRGTTSACDYVLVTSQGESFDDALDVLEDHERATLVGNMAVCREARRELRVARDRTVDLEAFERAGDGEVRITAIPLVQPTPASAGLAFMEGVGENLEAELGRMFSRSPLGQVPVGGLRSLMKMPNLGALGGPTVGEPALGFLVEVGGTSIALLGQGIHDGTDERDLEDLAALGAVDVLAFEAIGSIGAVVRAVRILEPRQVLLYRGHDPYGRGRRAAALRGGDVPVSSYVDAISEDQGNAVEARVLRPGDRVSLKAEAPRPATEARPS
jgi:L-ascorbate metabolism protein UlaG (beta-lactamase superfamily)